MDDNLEKRFRFAQYFANVTTSNEYKKGWNDYLGSVRAEVDKVKAEKAKLEAGLSGKSGVELEKAQSRIASLEGALQASTRQEPIELPLHTLNSIDTLLAYKLQCPKDSTRAIWSEIVSVKPLPDFPPRAYYITYGCRNQLGEEVGPSVSWYPDGKVIEEGKVLGEMVLYYPNGNKAAEGRFFGAMPILLRKWNLDGTPID